MVSEPFIEITLVYSPGPRVVREKVMNVPVGTTVRQALMQSRWPEEYHHLVVGDVPVGIWGRCVTQSHKLRDKDRIEIYRLLTVDPKVARRERFIKQGAKATGLFSKKREGAKAGY